MALTATPIPCLSDNYAWLLRAADGRLAVCDPAEDAPVARAVEAAGGKLDLILLTHHHGDHCGDTLFSLGCGRLLEGTAEQMFASLAALAALPGETLVCCGHEYTESNARFALTVEPDNAALKARIAEAQAQRAAGQPTLPSTIASERAANPFVRAPDIATLARIRAGKDNFR